MRAVQPRRVATRRLLAPMVVLGLLAAASARLFVWPARDRPAPADAIVMLGGDASDGRYATAFALAKAGYAPVLVISTAYFRPPHRLPDLPPGVEVMQFKADPYSTQGEARYAAELAAQHHWTRMIIVPSRPQATRARVRFERCFPGRVLVVPSPIRLRRWPYDILYEWGALAKALIWQRGC